METEMREMPRYQCHKKVWALKIARIEDISGGIESGGDRLLHFEDEGFAPRLVDGEYVHKHQAKAGGYFVQYEDGYLSFSPAEAFESGYTRI